MARNPRITRKPRTTTSTTLPFLQTEEDSSMHSETCSATRHRHLHDATRYFLASNTATDYIGLLSTEKLSAFPLDSPTDESTLLHQAIPQSIEKRTNRSTMTRLNGWKSYERRSLPLLYNSPSAD